MAVTSAFSGCFQSTKNFFIDPEKSHLAKFFRTAEGRDKSLKAIADTFGLISEIVSESNAADETKKGFREFHKGCKDARTALGIFNIFAGVIGGLYSELCIMGRIVASLGKTDSVSFKTGAVKYNEKAITKEEKLTKLGASASKFMSSAHYFVGFGICRPTAWTGKYFKLGETAKGIGNSFATVMMGNHIFGLFQTGLEGRYQHLAFHREAKNTSAFRNLYESYVRKIRDCVVGFIKNLLEFGSDLLFHLNANPPMWFKIPLVMAIVLLSLYKVWLTTN